MQNSHKTPLFNESGREMHDILFKKFHSEGRRQYDLHCQLSAVSLQAAIAEGGSEKEPLKPTDRHTSNHKIKRLQNYWKRNLRSWKALSREKMPSGSPSLGKSLLGKGAGNASESMKNVWE